MVRQFLKGWKMEKCTCGREFTTSQGLGQHHRHGCGKKRRLSKEDMKRRAAEIAETEESMAAGKGGEVSAACPPEDKEKAFWNGYWSAAHNIAHDIRDIPD
jgi:hypothetical protein